MNTQSFGLTEMSFSELQTVNGGDDYQLWHDVGAVVGYVAHAAVDFGVGFWNGLNGR